MNRRTFLSAVCGVFASFKRRRPPESTTPECVKAKGRFVTQGHIFAVTYTYSLSKERFRIGAVSYLGRH